MKEVKKQGYALLAWLWWLVSPLSLAHDFRGNPVIGSRWLNRLGLHVLRLLLAHAVTRLRWFMLRPMLGPEQRATFHRDGFLVIPDVLPAAQFAALLQEVNTAAGQPRQCVQGDTLTQRLLLDEQALSGMPVTARLWSGTAVAGALAYAGAKNCRPFLYIQKIRNGTRAATADPQKNLHSDTFHPTMKAWYFLDDVDQTRGPFTYVRGSNRLSWKRLRWEYRRSIEAAGLADGYSAKGSFRFSPEDLASLGLPDPESLTLPANTLVIANTFGIHCRGSAAPGACRREIWAYSRFNPFNPWPGIGLPYYSRADQALMKWWWQHLDRVAAARGQQSSWHRIDIEQFHQP
jgi:hypothetical protein